MVRVKTFAKCYFASMCVGMIIGLIVIQTLHLPDPLGIHDILSDTCTGTGTKSMPFDNDEYYSFWSAILITLALDALSIGIKVLKRACFPDKHTSETRETRETIDSLRSLRLNQKKCRHLVALIFILLNTGVYYFALIEYLIKLPSDSDALCKISFIVSSTLYKGAFGPLWRNCMGIVLLTENNDQDLTLGIKNYQVYQNLLIFVSICIPVSFGLTTFILSVPLAIIFIPICLGYSVLVSWGYTSVMLCTLLSKKNSNGENDENQGIEDQETEDQVIAKYGRSIIFIIFVGQLWILILFIQFYTGKSWSEVAKHSIRFFVPRNILTDLRFPGSLNSQAISLSVLGSELLIWIKVLVSEHLSYQRVTALYVGEIVDNIQTITDTVIDKKHQHEIKIAAK